MNLRKLQCMCSSLSLGLLSADPLLPVQDTGKTLPVLVWDHSLDLTGSEKTRLHCTPSL
jgi:hypothetical protein